MSRAILIDMNLPPAWADLLNAHGYSAVHWSAVGDPAASDTIVMSWARQHGAILFTHDLDFGALLALTHADGPSVLQVRAQNVLPEYLGRIVLAALSQHASSLASGAIVAVDQARSRVRVLPLK